MNINKERKVGRNSNIELLRILAIILITINHVTAKGIIISSNVGMANNALALFYLCGGKYGCNLFLIITVWYIATEKIQWRNILYVWYQTFIYYFVLGIIEMIYKDRINIKETLALFLPLITSNYWYCRSYILLLLLIPSVFFLFEKVKHKRVVLLSIVSLYTIFIFFCYYSKVSDGYIKLVYEIVRKKELWFILFSIIVYYIKNNVKIHKKHAIYLISTGIILYFTMFALLLYFFYIGKPYEIWRDIYSPLNYISAIFIFLGVQALPPNVNTISNTFASFVFGIYLFQCHKNIQPIIWSGIFSFQEMYEGTFLQFMLLSILDAMVVIIMGAMCEFVYKKVFFIPLVWIIRKANWYHEK